MSNAADRYKKLASAKRTDTEKTHEVTLPSGDVWKLADSPIQQFIAMGKLPAEIVGKILSIAQGGASAAAMADLKQNLSPEEAVKLLFFTRDLVLYCAREPRISLEYPVPDGAVAPEDILAEDFQFLSNWVMSGGKATA